jgi:hypothetical protein
MTVNPRLVGAALAALACSLVPGRADGQIIRGLVAEQLSLAPAQGAVVVLLRVVEPDGLESVGMTTTDGTGAFSLAAPGPGVYRLQADLDGLASPLSPKVELGPGTESTDEVALLLPSPLLHLALGCQLEAPEGTAAVVGTVRDPDTGVPLPDALITATWQEGRMVRRLEAQTGASGRYRICGLPAEAGTVRFQAQLLGRSSPQGEVEIGGPSVVFHDLAISVVSTVEQPKDVIQEQILLEAAAQTLGDLHGQIRDQISGAPLPYTVVRILGTPHQTLTDETGHFLFEDLTPDSYTLEIRNLGYAVTSDPVEVPPGKDVLVSLKVAPQVVELEGLEVTTRSAVERITRLTPFRMDLAFGEAMALEEQRGARAFEILRRTSPGLRVTEIYREAGPPTVCIQTNRRIQSLTDMPSVVGDRINIMESSLPSIKCGNVQVVVDGVKIPDGPEYLLRTPAVEIESMEFVSPVQAQILYGVGGDTSNGVVVIYTRGKGPYASPLRNRRN